MVTAWLGHMGRAWTGEPSDIAAALQHVHQAIQYLLRVRTPGGEVNANAAASGLRFERRSGVWHASVRGVDWSAACDPDVKHHPVGSPVGFSSRLRVVHELQLASGSGPA